MKFNYPIGSTPLNSDELADLIPLHITTQEELNAWEEKNILLAEGWAFKQKNILSVSIMQKLHERMFDKTWKWAGKFRKSEKNIGIHWSRIAVSLKELCDDVSYQVNHHVFSNDEVAIRFHHRLVSIHAFPNGNGRHARLMADMLTVLMGGKRFSWGMYQNLIKPSNVRKQYIEALQIADTGDFSKLFKFARS